MRGEMNRQSHLPNDRPYDVGCFRDGWDRGVRLSPIALFFDRIHRNDKIILPQKPRSSCFFWGGNVHPKKKI